MHPSVIAAAAQASSTKFAWMRAGVLAMLLASVLALALPVGAAHAQERTIAGFKGIEPGTRIVVMPVDVEIFEMTTAGMEPRADWTEQAGIHLRAALMSRKSKLSTTSVELPGKVTPIIDELQHLHRAVGDAMFVHHWGLLKLPTKDGKLDWSLGEEVRTIREATGADYALFTWMRDSHSSGGRVAMTIFAAAFGVAVQQPIQKGYASLVELSSGRIVWFNFLQRGGGDLREAETARETMEALLREYPG